MGGSLTGLMGAGAGLGASGLARLGGCLLPGWAPIPAKSPTPPPDGASWNHRLMLGDAPRLVDSAPWDAALLPAWLCRCWGVEAQRQCAGQSMGVGSPRGAGGLAHSEGRKLQMRSVVLLQAIWMCHRHCFCK